MTDLPADVAALVREREDARAAGDFARADALRSRIHDAGYVVRDTPGGSEVELAPPYETVDPRQIRSVLADPPEVPFSLHVLYEGFDDDLRRFVEGFASHNDVPRAEVLIVDNGSDAGERIDDLVKHAAFCRAIHLERSVGWAAARNAGLKTSRGGVIVLADLSVEPTGDILTPLAAALDDPDVGIAGPFGLVTDDMRTFEPSDGPEVDAIEGYLLAIRRDALTGGLIHEKFSWYRNADIDLSFQVRAQGCRAVVTAVPVLRHAHRGWDALDADERDRRSRKNHGVFYARWRERTDLLTRRSR